MCRHHHVSPYLISLFALLLFLVIGPDSPAVLGCCDCCCGGGDNGLNALLMALLGGGGTGLALGRKKRETFVGAAKSLEKPAKFQFGKDDPTPHLMG
jgi:hypothetical protein